MHEMTDEQWLAWLRERQASRLTVYNDVDRLLGIVEKQRETIDRLTSHVQEELFLLRMTQKAAREYRDAEMQMFRATGAEQRDELRGDLNRAQETLDKLLKAGDEG